MRTNVALVLAALLPAVPSAASPKPVSLAAGYAHACALWDNGQVRCWGNGGDCRLGNSTCADSATAILVPDVEDAIAIAAGGNHSCAVDRKGAVRCWGDNRFYQLGVDVEALGALSSPKPIKVNISGVPQEISAGRRHTCVRMRRGQILCWGDNEDCQLKRREHIKYTTKEAKPVPIGSVNRARAIAAGYCHTCAILRNGLVKCLGRIPGARICEAKTVEGLEDAAKISSGTQRGCAVQKNGHVKCWRTTRHATKLEAREVDGIDNAIDVTTGYDHACALLSNHKVKCWGWNYYGQTGRDTASRGPVNVEGIEDAVFVEAGGEFSCAILGSGQIKCWGKGEDGQLGNGRNPVKQASPVEVILSQ